MSPTVHSASYIDEHWTKAELNIQTERQTVRICRLVGTCSSHPFRPHPQPAAIGRCQFIHSIFQSCPFPRINAIPVRISFLKKKEQHHIGRFWPQVIWQFPVEMAQTTVEYRSGRQWMNGPPSSSPKKKPLAFGTVNTSPTFSLCLLTSSQSNMEQASWLREKETPTRFFVAHR